MSGLSGIRLSIFSGNNGPVGDSIDYTCDICREIITENTKRYHCRECKDFDMCETCYSKGVNETSKCNATKAKHWLIYEAKTFNEIRGEIGAQTNFPHALDSLFVSFSLRPYLGTISPCGKQYNWISYAEFRQKVLRYAKITKMLQEEMDLEIGSMFALCGINSVEWIALFYSFLYRGCTCVPLDITLPNESAQYIINSTEAEIIFTTHENLEKFSKVLNASNCPSVQRIIIYDDGNKSFDLLEHPIVTPVPFILLETLETEIGGKQILESAGLMAESLPPQHPMLLIHTSGSTGIPKGVVQGHSFFIETIKKRIMQDVVMFLHSPLALSSSHSLLQVILRTGGRVALRSSPLSNLWDEVKLVQPTTFSAVPSVWADYRARYNEELQKRISIVNSSNEEILKRIIDKLNQEFLDNLSSRARSISIGGAVSSPDLVKWMKQIFWSAIVLDSYGTSEVHNISVGHEIGEGVDLILKDWENYTSNTDPPSGEICVKTEHMITSYWKRPDLDDSWTPEGYFRTGDIGVRKGNSIFVVDRKNTVVKLQHGEFVCPERLESLLQFADDSIRQIFITPNELNEYLCAVIVVWGIPNQETKKSISFGLFQALASEARERRLRQFEIPSVILITTEEFTAENNMLTVSQKLCRRKIREKYSLELSTICNNYESSLGRSTSDIISLLQDYSPQEGEENNEFHHNFDSLAAVRFVSAVKEKYGVEISPSMVYEFPTVNQLVQQVQHILALHENGCEVSSLNQTLRSYNWFSLASVPDDLVKSFSPLSLKQLKPRMFNTEESKNCFLLTGATGFVGVFLLDSFVKLLCNRSGFKAICIVRGESNEVARTRLIAVIRNSALWDSLGSKMDSIEVLAGDISQEFLGLPVDVYNRVASEVDEIIHCAAMVNSVMSYSALESSNVKGTENVLRLCYAESGEVKTIHFISTIGVYNGDVLESRALPSPHTIRLSNGSGYNQSKWVAEKLLTNAVHAISLPLTIHRPGLVSGNTVSGVCNMNDWLVRLITGVMQLGFAPICAPELSVELIPVNILVNDITNISQEAKFLAASISQNPDPGIEVHGFNLINPDRGRISFRSLFSWLRDFMEQSCRKSVKLISIDDWSKLIETAPEHNALYPIRDKIANTLETRITNEYPWQWSDSNGGAASSVNRQILNSYFSFIQSSLLPSL